MAATPSDNSINNVEVLSDNKNIIADFSTYKIENWTAKSFAGETLYTIVNDGDKQVLKAQSN